MAKQTDPYRANNKASESTKVTTCGFGCPRLSITDTPDPVRAGELIVYDIKVTNVWDPYMNGSVVTFRVPAEAEYIGGCSYKDRLVTCYGSANQRARVILRPLVEGSLSINATVYPEDLSASATATTTVLRAAGPGANTPIDHADTVEQQSEKTQYTIDQIRKIAEDILANPPIFGSLIEYVLTMVCVINPFCPVI